VANRSSLTDIDVRVVSVDDPAARQLQDRQIAEMADRYGGWRSVPSAR